MEKVHLVVGRNNVGKSNLLHFAHDILTKINKGALHAPTLFPRPDDRPNGWNDQRVAEVSVGVHLEKWLSGKPQVEGIKPQLLDVFSQEPYSRGYAGVAWLDFALEAEPNGRDLRLRPSLGQWRTAQRAASGGGIDFQSVMRVISSSWTSDESDNLHRLMTQLAPWSHIPKMSWVDAVRELTATPESGNINLRNGRGLIRRLAELQRPPIGRRAVDYPRFEALTAFVQDVLDDPGAAIEIPGDVDTVHVKTTGREWRALDSLGTGISEVIILAAAATASSGELICMEEPEIHLHPALQRKLVSYLNYNTDNRYLISTHSAALLNAEIASISHVTMEGEFSEVAPVTSSSTLATAVADLGNRASDLVQSNFVVWVEGPSDRLYVKHWITGIAPDIMEGAHYSVMFYGGALLNHLTVEDRETRDLIDLLRINRQAAILIDSDRRTDFADLNATKNRVLGELSDIGAYGWVTDYYTIENYMHAEYLSKVVENEYPKNRYLVPDDDFTSPLGQTFEGVSTKPSKVTVAKAVAGMSFDKEVWKDCLWNHLEELIFSIRKANGMAPTKVGS